VRAALKASEDSLAEERARSAIADARTAEVDACVGLAVDHALCAENYFRPCI
jgi:hypothetical protein